MKSADSSKLVVIDSEDEAYVLVRLDASIISFGGRCTKCKN